VTSCEIAIMSESAVLMIGAKLAVKASTPTT
jgi:hypothetical protein